ncbi:Glucose-1-phosphate thymidylyltransferase 1 [Rubripirellula lacrimiformis]|uniref:Glucose-1-phosphate thymidylyltransferase n=1 Tax=Rubripirellula lacrimiformis TaxID=1930273 RepID=A0A517NLQ2_9BACT|nr:glucose-1-phosphate thymidylyltransferase RfbA [Rubripirellula lacrimiformis]QDT08064.1 Glucose-1-phosphate thymidylyltransferase 1 [Rubripirellula lacrimiformis]
MTQPSTVCTKGIILAGGSGSRLAPMTLGCNKQLLPVYDKPLIYYPLSTLMLAGIQDVLLISSPDEIHRFESLFGNGSDLGIRMQYQVQPQPDGLAQAFVLGESFIGNDPVALILGDNVFYGDGFSKSLQAIAQNLTGATVFAHEVSDPSRYGVIELDAGGMPISIVEKPVHPKSNLVIPGIYFFDHRVVEFAKALRPSARGEYEITDVIQQYLNDRSLSVSRMGRGTVWLDTGTPMALLQASNFIAAIEQRQGVRICCPEEIAARMGYITPKDLRRLAESMESDYGAYLRSVARQLGHSTIPS